MPKYPKMQCPIKFILFLGTRNFMYVLDLGIENTAHYFLKSFRIRLFSSNKYKRTCKLQMQIMKWEVLQLDPSPAFLTSDDFVKSNEIVRTKLPIYLVISHFFLTTNDLMISSDCKNSR